MSKKIMFVLLYYLLISPLVYAQNPTRTYFTDAEEFRINYENEQDKNLQKLSIL